jgi:hypothetical protein
MAHQDDAVHRLSPANLGPPRHPAGDASRQRRFTGQTPDSSEKHSGEVRMMFGLLIAIAAATFGAVAAIILLIAWAVRGEDGGRTMAGPPPGLVTHAVRRLLGLHATGVAPPGQDQHPGRRHGSGYTATGQVNDGAGRPHNDTTGHGTAFDGTASDGTASDGTASDGTGGTDPAEAGGTPAGWPGPRGPGPARWDDGPQPAAAA